MAAARAEGLASRGAEAGLATLYSSLEKLLREVVSFVGSGAAAANPFRLLGVSDSPLLLERLLNYGNVPLSPKEQTAKALLLMPSQEDTLYEERSDETMDRFDNLRSLWTTAAKYGRFESLNALWQAGVTFILARDLESICARNAGLGSAEENIGSGGTPRRKCARPKLNFT